MSQQKVDVQVAAKEQSWLHFGRPEQGVHHISLQPLLGQTPSFNRVNPLPSYCILG